MREAIGGGSMSRDRRVAIVGAGPAGARAAELLANRGAEVVLLDPRAPWEKPCGGGLPPPSFDDVPELAELDSVSRRVERVRIELSPDQGVYVRLSRPMRIVARRVLAAWQLERAVAAGAEHLPLRVRAVTKEQGSWRIETDERVVRASYLVGADGAASLVRRVASPDFRIELAPARVAYPGLVEDAPDLVVLRFYDGVAGYLWDFPRPDHRSVGIEVAAGTGWRRADLDAQVDDYRSARDAQATAEGERAGAVIGTAQLGHGDFGGIGGADFALLGDAAGLADPLTGEGIHNALRSAGLLADAWTSGDVLRYPKLARRAFSREFAVARFLRRSLLESGRGVALVRKALTSSVAYATVATLLDALNEHDLGVMPLTGRWLRTLCRKRGGPMEAAGVSSRNGAAPRQADTERGWRGGRDADAA